MTATSIFTASRCEHSIEDTSQTRRQFPSPETADEILVGGKLHLAFIQLQHTGLDLCQIARLADDLYEIVSLDSTVPGKPLTEDFIARYPGG